MSVSGARAPFSKWPACKTIVIAGALYDLVTIAPLAIPGLATVQLNLMFTLNGWLGFSGEMPDFEPVEMLFVNLFGVLALLWGLWRLFRYEFRLLQADLALRGTVSILLGYFAFYSKCSCVDLVVSRRRAFLCCGLLRCLAARTCHAPNLYCELIDAG